MMRPVEVGRVPEVIAGPGARQRLSEHATKLARTSSPRVLVVTGMSALERAGHRAPLLEHLQKEKISTLALQIGAEPSPELIDQAAAEARSFEVDLVVAVGGGSVLDAGKAIAALIPVSGSITSFLEGVGDRTHPGDTRPLIAIPTTAGTGSESTKNAVITKRGEGAFKKSLRHPNFVPRLAILDPELSLSLPPAVTAATGMDALTQLLESFLSTDATPFTDALGFEGLRRGLRALPRLMDNPGSMEDRAEMGWAAFFSGVTLAQAGLGLVHGLAGPLGAALDIPHGVVCGTLMGAANEANLSKMMEEGADLTKLARVGRLLAPHREPLSAAKTLVETLQRWADRFELPRLGAFGADEALIKTLAHPRANRKSPVRLNAEEIAAVMRARL